MKRARKSTKRMKRSNKRKYTKKMARKSARKYTRKSARKYARKYARKSARKYTRKSTKRYNGKQMGGIKPTDTVDTINSEEVFSFLKSKANGVIDDNKIERAVKRAIKKKVTFKQLQEQFNIKLEEEREVKITIIVSLGYNRDVAISALEGTNYDLEKAIEYFKKLNQPEMEGIQSHELRFQTLMDPSIISLKVENKETIPEIKTKLSSELDIEPHLIKLIYKGKELGDKELDEYKSKKRTKPIQVIIDPLVPQPPSLQPQLESAPTIGGGSPGGSPAGTALPGASSVNLGRAIQGLSDQHYQESFNDNAISRIVESLNSLGYDTTIDEIKLFPNIIRDPDTQLIRVGDTITAYRTMEEN